MGANIIPPISQTTPPKKLEQIKQCAKDCNKQIRQVSELRVTLH